MERSRIILFLLVAIVIAGLLSYAVYDYLQKRPATVVEKTPEKNIVVASKPILQGSLLKDDDVKLISWPANNLPVGYFDKKEGLVGRGVIQPLVENEPILESKLAPKESGAGLPPLIPNGKRAVSIRTSELIGVAGFVLPGTHVDVVLTATPLGAQEQISKIVLQNVPVLTAGQIIQKDSEGKPVTVSVVTLLVTPQEAEKLANANSQGQFQLALRNPMDLQEEKTTGIQLTQLMRGGAPPPVAVRTVARGGKKVEVSAPPPPPPQTFNVEVIKGDQRSTVKF
jgi:pilus assembly protein CpaB